MKKLDKIREILGTLNIIFVRQRSYISWLTPILLGGLYSEPLKQVIKNIFSNYWYIVIPAWIAFILFDTLILLPGEQVFYSKKNRIIMQMHDEIQKNNKT